jgi:hypothetical protein
MNPSLKRIGKMRVQEKPIGQNKIRRVVFYLAAGPVLRTCGRDWKRTDDAV